MMSKAFPRTLPAFPTAYSRQPSLERKGVRGNPSEFLRTWPARRVNASNCFSSSSMLFFENSRNFSWAAAVSGFPKVKSPVSTLELKPISGSEEASDSWSLKTMSSGISALFVFRISFFRGVARGSTGLIFFWL